MTSIVSLSLLLGAPAWCDAASSSAWWTSTVSVCIRAPRSFCTEELCAGADGNPYCKYDSQALQWFTSSLFIAGVFAALPAGHVTK